MIIAKLNNYRQSPRKVRLVTDLIKGKMVEAALNHLSLLSKRAADPIIKLLNTGIANAKNNFQLEKEVLYVKEITVDGGVTLHRRMPRARGSAGKINKRTSHITLVLAAKEVAAKEVKALKSAKVAKVPKKAKVASK